MRRSVQHHATRAHRLGSAGSISARRRGARSRAALAASLAFVAAGSAAAAPASPSSGDRGGASPQATAPSAPSSAEPSETGTASVYAGGWAGAGATAGFTPPIGSGKGSVVAERATLGEAAGLGRDAASAARSSGMADPSEPTLSSVSVPAPPSFKPPIGSDKGSRYAEGWAGAGATALHVAAPFVPGGAIISAVAIDGLVAGQIAGVAGLTPEVRVVDTPGADGALGQRLETHYGDVTLLVSRELVHVARAWIDAAIDGEAGPRTVTLVRLEGSVEVDRFVLHGARPVALQLDVAAGSGAADAPLDALTLRAENIERIR